MSEPTPNLNLKLLAIQKEIGAITKDSVNPFYSSKYFDINALLGDVKPILNKYGVVILQPLTFIGENIYALKTMLIDTESDEIIESVTPLPAAADAQKMGSAITYFRRYALQSLLALEAEDDDANAASTPAPKYAAKHPDPVAAVTAHIQKSTSNPTMQQKASLPDFFENREQTQDKLCIECGAILTLVPAGVSKKTGKAYKAFWACPDKHKQF